MPEVEDVRAAMMQALAEGGELTTDELTIRLNAVRAGEGLAAVTTGQVHALLTAAAIAGEVRVSTRPASPFNIATWAVKGELLAWGDPPRAQDPAERAEYWGGGIPGAYAPNMSEAWMSRWKAELAGTRKGPLRVIVRKSTGVTRGTCCQVKLIIAEGGDVTMSMNGTAELTAREFADLRRVAAEAHAAMARWRADRTMPGKAAGKAVTAS